MAKVKIYHNPRCSKSRQALEILIHKGCEIEVIEYLKNGLKKAEVEALYELLGDESQQMIRTKEDEFKSSPFDTHKKSEVLKGLVATPKLLERPIVIYGKKAIIARPPEKIDDII
jgi:arsenate reductase (glutaredoxin)